MPAALSSKDNSEISVKVKEYLEYLEVERGSSPLTIRNYKHYLMRFTKWLEKEGIRMKLEDINPEVIRQYRVYISRITDSKK